MARERSSPVGDERGISMVETLLAIALLGVIMAMFFTQVESLQTATAHQEARVRNNDEIKLALAQIDREIRSGNVLYNPATEIDPVNDVLPHMSLRIYTQADAPNRNPGNQCAQWRIINDEIQTRRWANEDPQGSVTPWQTVASGIVNRIVSPQVPAFEIEGGAAVGGRTINVTLVVDRPDDAADPMSMKASITGRNTQYRYPLQVCDVVPAY